VILYTSIILFFSIIYTFDLYSFQKKSSLIIRFIIGKLVLILMMKLEIKNYKINYKIYNMHFLNILNLMNLMCIILEFYLPNFSK